MQCLYLKDSVLLRLRAQVPEDIGAIEVNYYYYYSWLVIVDCSFKSKPSGYLDLVQRLEFGVDHLQKYVEYQIE